MHLFPLVTLFLLAPVWARDPTRSYYTVHVPEGDTVAAQALARRLQARYEGPIGELSTYYELSAPKGHDLGASYRRLRMKRDASLLNVASVRPQVRRRKLHKRAPPPILPPASSGQMDPHTSTVIQPIILTPEIASKLYPILENFDQEYRQNTLNAMDYLKRPNGYQQLTQALSIADPGIEQQWHLINHNQPGNDLNVTGVWSQGITGKGVVVAILDDGLDMDHADLKDNFYAAGSYDFNDHTDLPRPRLEDDTHGTRCAGEIAAKKNDVCGVGVAPDAKVAGIRILSEEITEEDEARALNYKYQENDIYSCSWGPPDYGEVAEAPEGMVLDAIKNGIANGRNGTGTIYVFASGNGGGNDDNCNFDGYTNSIYTITVGAIDRLGHHPYYAERCSAQLVVAYSSGSGGNIYTTDVGNDKCTDRHGGTSAAAPLAAGVFALVLSVRPDLSWRDLQYLCVESAKPFSLEDSDWSLLPSGRMYNHKFGYGRLDAYAIVELAKTFTNVGPQSYLRLSSPPRRRPIPDRASTPMSSIRSILTISEDMMDGAGLSRLEHVTATVFIEHARRGDLEILLHSPHNVTSQLGTPRRNDVSSEGLLDWTFMTVKHWGEDPVGDWTLEVIDWKNPEATGHFTNWTLTLWGERVEEVEGELIHEPVAAPPSTLPIDTPQDVSDASNDGHADGSSGHHEDDDDDEDKKHTPVLYTPLATAHHQPAQPQASSSAEKESAPTTWPAGAPAAASTAISDASSDAELHNNDNDASSAHSSTSSPSYVPVWLFLVPACVIFGYVGHRRLRRHSTTTFKDANYTSLSQQQPNDTSVYEFDTLHLHASAALEGAAIAATPQTTHHHQTPADDEIPLIVPASPHESSESSSREPSPTMKRQRNVSQH